MAPGCPRCTSSVAEEGDGWACLDHGAVLPFWQPGAATYESFAEHLAMSLDMPTYLPWPMGPDWSVARFGSVGAPGRPTRATAVACAGSTLLDGPVEVTIVAEEPGVALGARIMGTHHDDPGDEIGSGQPQVKVLIDHREVPLWAVSTSLADPEFDRTVFAGEAQGRWLWLMLRPAAAALLLRDDWILADVTNAGPQLVEMSFGGALPAW